MVFAFIASVPAVFIAASEFAVIVVVFASVNVEAVLNVASEFAVSVVVPLSVSVPDVVIVPSEVALIVVVPVKFVVVALMVNTPFVPLSGVIAILPVVPPPIVKVFIFNVWIDPGLKAKPFGAAAPGFAEILAVGVFPVTPVKANFALDVLVPPSNKSSVILNGDKAPAFSCQEVIPAVPAFTHVGVVPDSSRTCPLEPADVCVKTPAAFA